MASKTQMNAYSRHIFIFQTSVSWFAITLNG